MPGLPAHPERTLDGNLGQKVFAYLLKTNGAKTKSLAAKVPWDLY
jgi:hypothetical protein